MEQIMNRTHINIGEEKNFLPLNQNGKMEYAANHQPADTPPERL